MTPIFFGQSAQPIFGVHHPPRRSAVGPSRAVLICPPIGQEYIRSHWTLRLLANQLTRKGVHVFRVDYLGIGDSSKNISDVDSLEVWHSNVHAAMEKLLELSGATRIVSFGLRMGATFAGELAIRNPEQVSSVVSWEPVEYGAEFLKRLRLMHERMLDLWVCKMTTVDDQEREEILGSIYSRQLLDQIEDLRFDYAALEQPHLVVELEDQKSDFTPREPSLVKRISVDDEPSWNDLAQLETAWLRPKTIRTLVSSIDDLFERLQRFGVLGTENTNTNLVGVK